MKIYQVHEYGGQWEDRYDYIVGSYLSRERAYSEMEKLEKEEEYLRTLTDKCHRCPLYKKGDKTNIEKYCKEYEPFDINKHDPDEYDEGELCIHCYWNHEDSWFDIEEVEVIE